MSDGHAASTIQLLGAGGFGALVGWHVYFINRYRKAEVQITDLATLVGVLGGGAVLSLFPAGTDLFGAYGIGLFAGFLSYFLVLAVLVARSQNFTLDWFLDGRRAKLDDTAETSEGVAQTQRPMEGPRRAPIGG